ncbi:dTDP-4-dehydrorhamnose 3,5-epimerase family protein [Patescibacteria group bacterium]|nr:dTDP-4-dehydrorhamnose 3,5-epimerase family protein [Patescibacteria group bacterium]
MENTCIKKTSIPRLLIIERPVFSDSRGFFHEIFRLNDLEKFSGVKFNPVQWSHSVSLPGVIRAIHSEQWHKLVYPISGKMFGAYVDVRPDSKTFGKVETVIFDNESAESRHTAVFIPPGVGNSICVMGEVPVHYTYLVSEYWDNSKAQGIAWNDPDLAIDWPVKNPIISDRDKNNPTLRQLFPEKFEE